MSLVNPGHILPFYTTLKEQWRFRFGHAWGLPAPKDKLLPFQMRLASSQAINSGNLVSADGSKVYPLDLNDIVQHCILSDNIQWYTFLGNTNPMGEDVDCGLYFIRFGTTRGETYYSELLNLYDLPIFEEARLSITCSGSVYTLAQSDVVGTSKIQEKIQIYLNGDWQTIGTTSANYAPPVGTGWNVLRFRRRVTTQGGNHLETVYSLYYNQADPCTGYRFFASDKDDAGMAPYRHKLEWYNTKDIENILYAEGYRQRLYCDLYPARPLMVEDREKTLDGDGNEKVISSGVRRRRRAQVPNVADFMIFPLANLASHDTVEATNYETGIAENMTEVEFTYTDSDEGYFAIGELTYRDTLFQIDGCQEDFGAELCPVI